MGVFVLYLMGLEERWIVYTAAGLLGGVFVLALPDKRRLLTAIFILSLQVDVRLWLLHGHAGSAGLFIPFVVLAGIALFTWYAIAGHLRGFRLAGSMRRPILALFATTVLSLATTSEHFVGLTSLLYSVELYFLYWLTFNIVQSDDDFRRIIKLLLYTLAVQSIVYIIQSKLGFTFDLVGQVREGGGVPRPGGTVSTNPAGFTSFIMPALLITCALVMNKERILPRLPTIILFVLGTTAIGLSFTRAAWIGYALGVTAIVVYGIRNHAIKGSMVAWIVLFTAAASVILLPAMLTRISGDYGGDGQSTLDERWGLIRIAGNVIADNPLTGVGPGAYAHSYKGYLPGDFGTWVAGVHNEFVLRAAETGIPGAVAFIALLVVGFRVAMRLARTEPSLISISAMGWLAALIALVWQMNWVPWTGWSYNAMLWVMLGLMDGAQRLVVRDKSPST